MSLAIPVIDAALAADLTKNEYKAFLVLFRQTLCFGKTSDALTFKRLAKLAGIRKDRIKPALQRLEAVGLFETTPHKLYENTYRIAPSFLAQLEGDFVALPVPKNRNTFRNSGEKLPEKRVHTIHTSTNKTTTTPSEVKTEPKQNLPQAVCSSEINLVVELPYPTTWDHTQRSKAAQVLDGLSPQQAHDCLVLLAQSLTKGKVTNSMGYLHTLAKAARANTLDRSALLQTVSHTSAPQPHLATRLNELKAEIAGIDALFNRAGIPLDSATAAKRASYVDQYNALKQGLGG